MHFEKINICCKSLKYWKHGKVWTKCSPPWGNFITLLLFKRVFTSDYLFGRILSERGTFDRRRTNRPISIGCLLKNFTFLAKKLKLKLSQIKAIINYLDIVIIGGIWRRRIWITNRPKSIGFSFKEFHFDVANRLKLKMS